MFKINLLTWGKCASLYTKLGRWKIDHDVRIINIKIDQANHDNGDNGDNGDGGMYIENVENTKKDKEKNDFLVPYCM